MRLVQDSILQDACELNVHVKHMHAGNEISMKTYRIAGEVQSFSINFECQNAKFEPSKVIPANILPSGLTSNIPPTGTSTAISEVIRNARAKGECIIRPRPLTRLPECTNARNALQTGI